MPRTSDKRERLTQAARDLFHSQGFQATSLADVAERAGVPLGNVYYYFKTKTDLVRAVVEGHRESHRAVFGELAGIADPKERLLEYLATVRIYADNIAENGCPVGTFASELNKHGEGLAEAATAPLDDLIAWFAAQFGAIGFETREADLAARKVMRTLQGGSLLANSYRAPEHFIEAVDDLVAWISPL